MNDEEKKDQERTRIAKSKFLKALAKTAGNITAACEKCDIGRTTFYLWRDADEAFMQRVHEVEESRLDMAESALMSNIVAKKESSIFFFLNNKGKSRGYRREAHLDHTTKGNAIRQSNIDLSKLSDSAIDEIIASSDDKE